MRRSSLCERDIFCFCFFIVLLCRKMFLSCSCSSRWCLDSVDTFKTVDKHTAEMCCWNVTQRCLCPAALYYHQRPYKGWKRHLNPSWLLGQMARHPVINTWADYEILGPWAQTCQSPPQRNCQRNYNPSGCHCGGIGWHMIHTGAQWKEPPKEEAALVCPCRSGFSVLSTCFYYTFVFLNLKSLKSVILY